MQPQLHSALAIYISIMKEKNGTYVKTTGSSSNIIQAIKGHQAMNPSVHNFEIHDQYNC